MAIALIRRLPVNFNEQDKVFFEREFTRVIDEPSSVDIQPALITSQGIVFSGWRLIRDSLIPEIPNTIGLGHLVAQRVKNKAVKWSGGETPALVFDYWYKGYFHWMTEALPRLLLLSQLGDGFIPVVPLDPEVSFIQKTLEPFSFASHLTIQSGEYLIAKKALLIKHTAPTGNFNEHLIRELRTLFRSYFVKTVTTPVADRIYISRRRTNRRRVINDEEVTSLLRNYGFVTLYFEDYNFEKQVQLAAHATMMVSIHGAGLTNMLFMNAGASVLEFRPRNDQTNLCYFALASALELKYFYQFGDPGDSGPGIHEDLLVDVHRLKANIEQMIAQP